MTWASSQGSISLIDEAKKGWELGKEIRSDWDASDAADAAKAASDEDRRKATDAAARSKDGAAGYGPQQQALPNPTDPTATTTAPTGPTYHAKPADLSTTPHPGLKADQAADDGRERASQRYARQRADSTTRPEFAADVGETGGQPTIVPPPQADPSVTGAQDTLSQAPSGANTALPPGQQARLQAYSTPENRFVMNNGPPPTAQPPAPAPASTPTAPAATAPAPSPATAAAPPAVTPSTAAPAATPATAAPREPVTATALPAPGAPPVPAPATAPAPAPAPAPTPSSSPAPPPASATAPPSALARAPEPALARAPEPATPPAPAPAAATPAPAPQPAGTTPPAQGPQASLGDKLWNTSKAVLSALNPIGTAEAAETRPMAGGGPSATEVTPPASGFDKNQVIPKGLSYDRAFELAQKELGLNPPEGPAGRDDRYKIGERAKELLFGGSQGKTFAQLDAEKGDASAPAAAAPTATGALPADTRIPPRLSLGAANVLAEKDLAGKIENLPAEEANRRVVERAQDFINNPGKTVGEIDAAKQPAPNASGGSTLRPAASTTPPPELETTPAQQALPAKGATSSKGATAAPAAPDTTNAPNAPIEKGMPPPARVTLPQVPASQAPVAPNQTSPTTQSERTPEVRTPGINPQSLTWLKTNRPDDAEYVQKMADKYGVTPERIAAHWWKESGLVRSVHDGTSGEQGVMQVMPGTRDQVDPRHELDPYNHHDSIETSARIIRDLDHRFGKDTFSSVLAYNGGPGTADRVAAGQPTNGNAVKYASHPVFFGGETINASDITGSIKIDPNKMQEAAEKAGPSGVLSYIANTEPNNMPLSDKWYAAKRALVDHALRFGGANAIEQARAADQWVFEQSRQGVNESLVSAYNAMQAGDSKGAAQYLAKAHAFFPDGSVGQFGVDDKGQIWTQRVDEHDPSRKLGSPTMITKDQVAGLLITSRDPNKHLTMLDAQEKHVAEMRHQSKQEDYWQGSLDNKKEMDAIRQQRVNDQFLLGQQRLQEQQAAHEAALQEAQRKLFEQQAQHQKDMDARKQAVDGEIKDEYGTGVQLKHPDGALFSEDDTARSASVYRDLRTSPVHIAVPEAKRIANSVASGTMTIHPGRSPATAENPQGVPIYTVKDAKSGLTQAVISKETGDRLVRGGLAPPPPPRAPTAPPPMRALPPPPASLTREPRPRRA